MVCGAADENTAVPQDSTVVSGRRGGEGQSTEELRGSDFHLHHLSTDVHTVFGFSSVHWNLILTHSLHTVSVVRMLLHIHTHTDVYFNDRHNKDKYSPQLLQQY